MVKNVFPRKIKMQYWDGKIGLFYFSRHDLFCTYYFIFAGHAESTTYLYTYLSTFHFETFNIRFFCSYIKGGFEKVIILLRNPLEADWVEFHGIKTQAM